LRGFTTFPEVTGYWIQQAFVHHDYKLLFTTCPNRNDTKPDALNVVPDPVNVRGWLMFVLHFTFEAPQPAMALTAPSTTIAPAGAGPLREGHASGTRAGVLPC
jgi:hypothetical protein